MQETKLPDWQAMIGETGMLAKVSSIDEVMKTMQKKGEPHGFVYWILFSNGQMYLGKKNFYSERNVKKGKRELAAMADKRGSKKKKVVKESDWKKYYGSFKNTELVEKLKSGEITIKTRQIIDIAFSKSHLTYLETKYLFSFDVLLDEMYINDNILGKFYSGRIFKDEIGSQE